MMLECLPRSSENYKRVLDSLDVEHNARFQKRDITGDGRDETFCNWLVADACGLLEVHLPKGLKAREQVIWLAGSDGKLAGWFECQAKDAGEHANLGHPTIAGWVNPDPERSSHVAMLRSSGRVCQAGARNYNDTPILNGFGVRAVRYFTHL
jgi:hypothetical protein